MEFAGFGSRFVAWLLDGFLIGVLAVIFGLCAGLVFGVAAFAESSIMTILAGGIAFVMFVILLFFEFVYFGYFWSKDGRSLGMKLLNIKVTRRDGSLVSFWRGGFRGTIGYAISGLIFGLGFIWAAFDANKESWHDKLFDTWVVRS